MSEQESRTPLVQGPRPELNDAPAFWRAVDRAGGVPAVDFGNAGGSTAEQWFDRIAETAGDGNFATFVRGHAANPAFEAHLDVLGGAARRPALVFVLDTPLHAARRLERDGQPVVFELEDGTDLGAAVDEGLSRFLVDADSVDTLTTPLSELSERGIDPADMTFFIRGASADACAGAAGEFRGFGARLGVVVPGEAYLASEEAVETDAISPDLRERTARSEVRTIDDLHRTYRLAPSDGDAGDSSSISRERTSMSSSHESTRTQSTNSDIDDGAVAIVGIGATMPQAMSADQFWENIQKKVYAVTETPPDRWDPELYWDPDPEAPDKTYSKIGGWIREFEFDRKWHRIPPFTVENMDSAQLMAMDTTKEALENAGYLESDFDNERTAVILGNTLCGELRDWTNLRVHYPEFEMDARKTLLEKAGDKLSQREIDEILGEVEERFKGRRNEINEDSMPGELPNVIAGRVANSFNLRGPNFTTDAACASSLSSVVQAVRGLRNGRWDMAVSGGVDRFMGPSAFVKFCKIGALSPDGSRPFDEDANGFVMGEGCGILLLKRLEDAVEDDDEIYGVIRGVGASSDGAGKGITAPNPKGQKLSIQRAYEDAGYGPRSISLLEAHGTSTPIGDPTEFNSTRQIVAEDNGPAGADRIGLGSVKSMIGHLKAGAGAASLIKVAYALRDKKLPPTLNVENPHPELELDQTPFEIQNSLEDWETNDDMPRRAGVSAFGFGGTNYHVTLEEYDPARYGSGGVSPGYETTGASSGGGDEAIHADGGEAGAIGAAGEDTAGDGHEVEVDQGLMTFGGATEQEVADQFAEFAERFRQEGLEATRPHHVPLEAPDVEPPEAEYRLAVAYRDDEELDKQVGRIENAFERGRGWNILANQGVYFSSEIQEGDIAMLFPGQGTQYLGMLSDLKQRFPLVQEIYDEADRVMRPVLDGENLSEIIDPEEWTDEARERLKQTEITQPAVLTADTAILKLLEKFGIEPDVVAGHSLGEYGALIAAGVMPFEGALRTVARRGTAMAEASPMHGDDGLMASVSASPDEIEPRLDEIDGYVVCANKNCPKQTIIAGLTEPTRRAAEMFEEEGHMVQFLNVSHAFHTKVVAEGSEPLREHLEGIEINSPEIPILTNVTGEYHPDDPDAIRDLLAEQVAAPVEWMTQLERMYEDGARAFVEAGPKSALTTFVESTLGRDRDYLATHTNHPKEGGLASLYRAMGQLWAEGVWSGERKKTAGLTAEAQSSQRNDGGEANKNSVEEGGKTTAGTTSGERPGREEILETMLEVLCEKTGYDPAEIEYDFELEADLGVDTVKQAEILADVRDKWGLAKDEDFRFSEYPTLERLADYVEERFDEGAFAEGEGGEEKSEEPTAEAQSSQRNNSGETNKNSAGEGRTTAKTSVEAPDRRAAREVRAELEIEGDETWKVAGGLAEGRDEISRHEIAASTVVSGGSLGLPGMDEMFDEKAVERLLEGDNFISELPREVRAEIVDKEITRLEKHEDGGGELVDVEDVEEVIQLAARAGEFDLGEDWNVPNRLVEALDHTSRLAFAAGLEALRDAGLPLVPQYRETQSGKKLTKGWKLPDRVGDETGVIFATAFAGQDAFAEELEEYYTDDDYEFNHRLLLRMLGIANSRFAEHVGARGPNTKINNACASTTTALGIAQDWIEQGRCERVVVLSADNATGEQMMEWVGSGFLATGAATTKEDVEEAALPFDERRNGMIVGMGAVSLVVERDGLPEARGIEPLADLMSTHFVNSAHHPTRLDVDHIAGEVGDMLTDVEADFELDRGDIAPNTVFVSHETYTPARGGSAAAEIAAIRDNFGDRAEKLVIANTKGYTGHAQGASIEEILAVKSLQHTTVPAIANFEQPDPELGDLRLSEGGEYPVDYALRLAAGFGSQLALALYRFRAREQARLVDQQAYLGWVAEVTDFDAPELAVEHRTLRVRDGRPDDRPTDPSGGGGESATPEETPSQQTPSEPDNLEAPSPTPARAESETTPGENETTPAGDDEQTQRRGAASEQFPTESILVEADTSAAYDPLKLEERLEGSRVVILAGPMLVTNMMRRATERCGAEVLVLEESSHRGPLENDETVCDLFDEGAIRERFDEFGPVDGIVNLLGFGQEKYKGDEVHRVARQTFHTAKAWQDHLGEAPDADNFWVTVTGMGGRLGFDQATSPLPVCGAVCGLTKSLGREWADTNLRVVDVPREGLYPDLGLQILAETFADVPSPELGLLGGVRYLPVAVGADEIIGHGAGESIAPDDESVVVLAGGGKGITARVGKDLATRYGSKLALVGRTELDHPDPLSVDMDEAKAEAKERIEQRGDRVTPVRVQEELKPLKSQRAIHENMNEMRELGAEVEYFSCDVAEAGEVAELMEAVAERFGTVDGVVHGAGAEISEMLDKKTGETFDIVFDGKALGGLNLWSSVREYDPDFLITFSSVVSRFGNVGQTDYAAANEVLNKLVAHINATSEVDALSIDWTAWDEIGMAVQGSMKTILQRNGVEFLPPEIGAPMVADALEQGLTGEVMVAGELGELSGPFRLRRENPGAPSGARRQQLVFADNVTDESDERIVLERVFDPERDRFLDDHVYDGNPVLPGVMGYEMMAEAVRRLTDRTPFALTDVQFDRAVKLHHGDPIRVIVTAESTDGTTVEATLESERTVKTGRTVRNEHFRATAEMEGSSEREPTSFELDSTAQFDAGPDKPEIYRRFFHTGTFQVMESVPHLGDEAVVGYGRQPSAKLVADDVHGRFVTDPMVREMAFQTTGLWGMIRNQKSYLPYAIGRSVHYDDARPGERICVRGRRRPEQDTDHTIAFDVEVRSDRGRLLQRMERVELVGHRKLDDEEAFPTPPARRMTLNRLSHPEAQAVLSDRDLTSDEILTDQEAASLERLRSERRRGEWLAARVAAKQLVCRYARDFAGVTPALGEITVVKDDQGAPHLELRGEAERTLAGFPLPNLTLTHAGGVAIAGIAGPGRPARIGLDLEAIEERDDNFADNYFTQTERALELTGDEQENFDRWTKLTALWSCKEAVSKALGLGLKLALGELIVETLRADDGRIVAEVTLNGKAAEAFDEIGGEALEVRVRIDGTFALASAHILLEHRDEGPAKPTNGRGDTNGSPPETSGSGEYDEEFAAVAALLEHKGLLDTGRTRRHSDDEPSGDREDVSSWKHGK